MPDIFSPRKPVFPGRIFFRRRFISYLYARGGHKRAPGMRWNTGSVWICTSTPLTFVPGIEVDCNFEGIDLHLLGYGIDRRSRDFASLEQDVAAKVTEAFGETVHRLRKLGFAVDGAAVLAAAGGKLPTLELVAEVMLSDAAYDTPLLAGNVWPRDCSTSGPRGWRSSTTTTIQRRSAISPRWFSGAVRL